MSDLPTSPCPRCPDMDLPPDAKAPPLLLWDENKRLFVPSVCQLFDAVRPTPEHPHFQRMSEAKSACAEYKTQTERE